VEPLVLSVDDDVDRNPGLGVVGDLDLEVRFPVAGGDLHDQAEARRVVAAVLDQVFTVVVVDH
jgi:hypothetical protein